ncbi:MAG TPA: O-antigen ligase family protein [Terriglobia bacterium]|nr:O-antigen ligase family protein [Terriglobia bacterium]
MLRRIGIDNPLQLAITICVLVLIVVTTLGGSGGAPWVFLTYRTDLLLIAVLCAIGSRHSEERIHPLFVTGVIVLLASMLISVLRIHGGHFEALYLWYKYAFFAFAFLSLAKYARYQSARWRTLFLVAIIVVGILHLLPDVILRHERVVGFSANNANYFGTFLLIGLAATIAFAVYGTNLIWRAAACLYGALFIFGILKTFSRGAAIAAAAMIVLAAIRARGRISRQVWLAIGLIGLVMAIAGSPILISKFTDRGERDPYNYARKEIWLGTLPVIEQHPLMGVGFGQFLHISKRFTLPIDGTVARYLKRSQMAHNEYLQHMAEQGIPAALLMFFLLGYSVHLAWIRSGTTWREYRLVHEAAILTAVGVGIHALVDNCWIIPVMASGLVVLAMADPLPLRKAESPRQWKAPQLAFASLLLCAAYALSVVIPGIAIHYNEIAHQAYDRSDFATAEKYHLKAIGIVPNHPVFLDNLGMVYLQKAIDTQNPKLLAPAREYFARAITANPLSLDPHIHMETTLIRLISGDPARDADTYREIIKNDTEMLEIDPFVPFPRKNLASAYYQIGEKDEAFRQVEKAISYEPNYVPGYLQLAAWYADRGDMNANNRYINAAVAIAQKYRNFKPREAYEGVLLGRPAQTIAQK